MAIRKGKTVGTVATSAKVEPKVEPKVEDKTGKSIRAMDFVPVWQKASSVAEAAEHFGKEEIWASSFASRLRKAGVNLKKMEKTGGGGRRLNIDELNALI